MPKARIWVEDRAATSEVPIAANCRVANEATWPLVKARTCTVVRANAWVVPKAANALVVNDCKASVDKATSCSVRSAVDCALERMEIWFAVSAEICAAPMLANWLLDKVRSCWVVSEATADVVRASRSAV